MPNTYPDSRGLALTAASPEAAEAWDRTVRSYLGMRRDTGDRLKEAYAADADMPMAHCLRGYFMLLFSEAKRWAAGRKSLAAAQRAAADRPVTEREAAHIAALDRWAAGDMTGATALWDGILTDHPHDLLAMRLAHYTHFYSGDSAAMRDSMARIMHAWDPTVPDYGFVAGCYAFALEEDGDYARAEQRGREAVGINPDDPWGTHAVAHVMEMQGRQAEGIAWLSALEPHWTQVQNFRFHLWWHRALFHLELGEYDAVLDLYDRGVREEETGDYLDLTNAVALLWRLESEGVDVGDRWREVAGHCAEHAADLLLAFVDAHYAIALARTGDGAALADHRAGVRNAAQADGSQAPIYRDVATPVCDAAAAYYAGDYGRAADLLGSVRYGLRRLGGSHAQRDLFAQMHIEATIRAGRTARAKALVAERAERRPTSAWTRRRYAALFGDADGPAGQKAAALG